MRSEHRDTIVFAISDELHQSFVPSRTASAMDVLIDAIGRYLRDFVGLLAKP
jgi:VanZ family protein